MEKPCTHFTAAGDVAIAYQVVSDEDAKFLADGLPNGRLKVLDRDDHLPWIGDLDEIADEITSFALASKDEQISDRILATILMTDDDIDD